MKILPILIDNSHDLASVILLAERRPTCLFGFDKSLCTKFSFGVLQSGTCRYCPQTALVFLDKCSYCVNRTFISRSVRCAAIEVIHEQTVGKRSIGLMNLLNASIEGVKVPSASCHDQMVHWPDVCLVAREW